MATIRVIFHPSSIPSNEGSLSYLVIHGRVCRSLSSGHRLLSCEWDEIHSRVDVEASTGRRRLLLSVQEGIHCDIARLYRIIRRLNETGVKYSTHDIVSEYHRYSRDYSLSAYMNRLISRLRANGKTRTAEAYSSTLRSFRSFLTHLANEGKIQSADIMLDFLSSGLMEEYAAWQIDMGNTRNTISFYTRILRATYNRIVMEDAVEDRHPFHTVYTGIDKTVRRALTIDVVKRIYELDLAQCPEMDFARDMFMMSFMLRGMSFIDMAYLRKSDLKNGYIVYRRRKTQQQLMIAWTKEMQAILDKYPANKSEYLLPIIKKPCKNERNIYKNTAYNVNHNLKRVAAQAGIRIPLTLYVARHSWASIAKAKGISLNVISQGLGHDSESTTMIYLSSLDTSIVDNANAIILASL